MNHTIMVEAPAKINLILDIAGKRNDGYHEIKTVMHKINLLDRLYIKACGSGIVIDSDSSVIPRDHTNLAYRAAEKMLKKYGCKRQGVEIFIEKNIPVAAGLAGGSTDAAAVLKGLNQLYQWGVSQEALMEIGASIGSDIPFCLLGHDSISETNEYSGTKLQSIAAGTALAEGRGERLTILDNCDLPWILLVNPGFELSTAQVYRSFRKDLVKEEPNVDAFLRAWQLYDMINIAKHCENVLESVSTVMYPEISHIKKIISTSGALKSLMSGSGPTVFGIFDNQDKALLAMKTLQSTYNEVHLVSSYIRGGELWENKDYYR